MPIAINSDLLSFFNQAKEALNDPTRSKDTVILKNASNNVTTHNWVSYFKRDADFVQDSKRARQALLDAVRQEFKSVGINFSKIPKSVLAKMKLDCFDISDDGMVRSGRPLTARRIVLITQAVVSYKRSLQTLASSAVLEGVADLKGYDGRTPLAFSSAQIKTMTDMVMRDFARCDAEKRPRPTLNALKASFADGTHPALVAVTAPESLCTNSDISNNPPAKHWNEGANVAVYLRGEMTRQELHDRQDLLRFVFFPGREAECTDSLLIMAVMCEHLPQMRSLQPTGTLSFDTVWRVLTGEKVPTRLAKADDAARLAELGAKTVDLLRRKYDEAHGQDPDTRVSIRTAIGLQLSLGIKPSVAVRMLAQPNSSQPPNLKDDFIGEGVGYFLYDLDNLTEDKVFDILMKDCSRNRLTVTVGEKCFNLMRLDADKPGDRRLLNDFISHVRETVGDDRRMQNAVLIQMCQAGWSPTFIMGPLGQTSTSMDISLQKDKNGDFSLHYALTEDAQIDVAWHYAIAKNGSSQLKIDRAVRRPDESILSQKEVDEANAELKNLARSTMSDWLESSEGASKCCSTEDVASLRRWMTEAYLDKSAEKFAKSFVREFALARRDGAQKGRADELRNQMMAMICERLASSPMENLRTAVKADIVNRLPVKSKAQSDAVYRHLAALDDTTLLDLHEAARRGKLSDDALPVLRPMMIDLGILEGLRELAKHKTPIVLNADQQETFMSMVREELRLEESHSQHRFTFDEIANRVKNIESPGVAFALAATGIVGQLLIEAHQGLLDDFQQLFFGLKGVSDTTTLRDRLQLLLTLHNADKDKKWFLTNSGILSAAYLYDLLPSIRAKHPEGEITRAFICDALHEAGAPAVPKDLDNDMVFTDYVTSAMTGCVNSYREKFKDYESEETKNFNFETFSQLTLLFGMDSGIRFTSLLRFAVKDPSFTFDPKRDFLATAPLYAPDDALRLDTSAKPGQMTEIEKQMARDFVRQQIELNLGTGEQRKTIDLSGVTTSFNNASQCARETYQYVSEFLAGVPPKQRAVALTGLIQSALGIFKTFGLSEHASFTVTMTHEPNGDVMLSYRSKPWAPLDMSYAYVIRPDGTSVARDIRVQPRSSEVCKRLDQRFGSSDEHFGPIADALFNQRLQQMLASIPEGERPFVERSIRRMYNENGWKQDLLRLCQGEYAAANDGGEEAVVDQLFEQRAHIALDNLLSNPEVFVKQTISQLLKDKVEVAFTDRQVRQSVVRYLQRLPLSALRVILSEVNKPKAKLDQILNLQRLQSRHPAPQT